MIKKINNLNNITQQSKRRVPHSLCHGVTGPAAAWPHPVYGASGTLLSPSNQDRHDMLSVKRRMYSEQRVQNQSKTYCQLLRQSIHQVSGKRFLKFTESKEHKQFALECFNCIWIKQEAKFRQICLLETRHAHLRKYWCLPFCAVLIHTVLNIVVT